MQVTVFASLCSSEVGRHGNGEQLRPRAESDDHAQRDEPLRVAGRYAVLLQPSCGHPRCVCALACLLNMHCILQL